MSLDSFVNEADDWIQFVEQPVEKIHTARIARIGLKSNRLLQLSGNLQISGGQPVNV
jgi:hypothetical protein